MTETTIASVARSIVLFVAAGLCEIGGGYLVWRWWREGAAWPMGTLGAMLLILYGIIPTFQPAPFGRVYAAYGGIFVLMSLMWARTVDGFAPDRFDIVGAALCLAGVGVMMYTPR
jgi:small multidrug resistance family-3 protein